MIKWSLLSISRLIFMMSYARLCLARSKQHRTVAVVQLLQGSKTLPKLELEFYLYCYYVIPTEEMETALDCQFILPL